LDRLSPELQQAITEAVSFTKDNTGLRLNVAFDYGGRDEILQALKKIIMDGVSPSELDTSLFTQYLYTNGTPDPDLIIRTAGEMRLSNFLIWQSAYSEYYSASVLWPDFNESEIDKALRSYRRRQRRFGAIPTDSLG
jgi:undecaprenyl diphosphate synthase